MESKKINQLATELAPDLSDLTIIGDPTTGISKKITLSQMASLFTGTVEEYATLAAFPLVGVADTIYIALDTNIIYRYDTSLSAYVILSPNIINSLVFSDANGFDGTITLVGSVATLSITTALTSGSVPFIGASGALTQDNSNLFFDDTNNRLGIATASPTTPLDVFGSGIIGRLNATSTNNAYLGFASNGTNKWSAGNVQSDHRFRIFSEANSAELITILQTGEFGIGIANPLTKLHIDGAASALIANLDANVSVAKSLSFRSDNSNRINLEVSGTESGSNAGADFFIRRYSDAGSLIDTPLTITRSTGAISLATALSGTSASFSSTATATAFIPSGATIPTNGMYLSAANTLNFATNTTNRLTIASTGLTTFSAFGTHSFSSGGTGYNKLGIRNTTAGAANGAQLSIGTDADPDQFYVQSFATTFTTSGMNIAGGAVVNGEGPGGLSIAATQSNIGFYTNGAGSANLRINITSGGFINLANNTAQLLPISASNFQILASSYYNGSNIIAAAAEGSRIVFSSGSIAFSTFTGATIGNSVTDNERLRIQSDGTVLAGTTNDGFFNGSVTGTGMFGPNGFIAASRSNSTCALFNRFTSTGDIVQFRYAGSNVGTISTNGSTITFSGNALSDERFKENIKSIENALDSINKIQFKTFVYKNNKQFSAGVTAQQLETIDELKKFVISGIDEESYKAVDYNAIIGYLGKAIQELKAEIDILKAK